MQLCLPAARIMRKTSGSLCSDIRKNGTECRDLSSSLRPSYCLSRRKATETRRKGISRTNSVQKNTQELLLQQVCSDGFWYVRKRTLWRTYDIQQTICSRILSEKLIVTQLDKKLLACYGKCTLIISTHCYFLIVSQTNPVKAYPFYFSNIVTLSTLLSSFQRTVQVRKLV